MANQDTQGITLELPNEAALQNAISPKTAQLDARLEPEQQQAAPEQGQAPDIQITGVSKPLALGSMPDEKWADFLANTMPFIREIMEKHQASYPTQNPLAAAEQPQAATQQAETTIEPAPQADAELDPRLVEKEKTPRAMGIEEKQEEPVVEAFGQKTVEVTEQQLTQTLSVNTPDGKEKVFAPNGTYETEGQEKIVVEVQRADGTKEQVDPADFARKQQEAAEELKKLEEEKAKEAGQFHADMNEAILGGITASAALPFMAGGPQRGGGRDF